MKGIKETVKTLLKSLLPKPVRKFIHKLRIQNREKKFFRQGVTTLKWGAYEIVAPDNHVLVGVRSYQPDRDLFVGIAARYISAKYPSGTIVDIGANIGDTAAIVANYAHNKLILVEPSEYFFDFLVRNVSQLPNKVIVKRSLIFDGSMISGYFSHWKGTASFIEDQEGDIKIKTEKLADIADEKTCFVKIDTDGYDFQILLASLEWLASVHPVVLFENEIRNSEHLTKANELYVQLQNIGYTFFIVWDDPGFYHLSTTDLSILLDLNRYLLKVSQYKGPKNLYNYDVLCLHKQDEDIYKNICEWYRMH